MLQNAALSGAAQRTQPSCSSAEDTHTLLATPRPGEQQAAQHSTSESVQLASTSSYVCELNFGSSCTKGNCGIGIGAGSCIMLTLACAMEQMPCKTVGFRHNLCITCTAGVRIMLLLCALVTMARRSGQECCARVIDDQLQACCE
jgi:hypothetical protein